MGCIHRKLVVIAALAPFLAGCAAEALGPEYREISEEESGLQFYAPGLEGGYRNIIIGQDAKFIKRMIAVYGPQQGEFPRGQLALIEMPPGRHFTRVNPPGDTIEKWGAFENRNIVRGPTGTAVNKIGRIEYAAFQADGVACVIFRQPFGTIYDTGRGTRLLDGFYCKGEAAMMSAAEAESIVRLVGHHDYGRIAPPSESRSDAVSLSAEIIEFGTYIPLVTAEHRAGGASVEAHRIKDQVFVDRTDRVTNKRGSAFGIGYVLRGPSTGKSVELLVRLRHPEFKGRRYKEWKTRPRVGDRTFVGFRFDYEFEQVPGT